MVINVNNPPVHAILIGRVGENDFRMVTIDVSPWLAVWPDGEISLIYRRPDGELYPVVVNATKSPVTWRPTATDTAVSGSGALEVRIACGDVLGKSCTIRTKVVAALGAPGDPPPPSVPHWTQVVSEAAASAEAARDAANEAAQRAEYAADEAAQRAENAAANTVLVYNDSIKEWSTCVMKDDYVIANHNFTISAMTVDSSAAPVNIAKTGLRYLPTPLPIDMLTVSASCDRRGQYISNVNNVSGEAVVGFSYRVYDPTNPATISSVARISLFGRRPATPSSPTVAYNATAAAEIVSIAQSYVTAREGGRRFAYGPSFFYSSSQPINDATGAALMECDTYVGLVLRGISYANSPFADNTPNLMYSYDTMMAETGNHSTAAWCTKIRGLLTGDAAHNVLGRDVKFASDNAWLAWLQNGSVFSDVNAAMPGDLAFFKRKQSQNFDNVGHVAILGENGMLYEVTTAANSEGRVLQKIAMNEKTEQPTYFARLY